MEAEQKIVDRGLDQSIENANIDLAKENKELKAKIEQLEYERDILIKMLKQNNLGVDHINNEYYNSSLKLREQEAI